MRVFRERLSICVCASVPFSFEGGMWDLVVLILNFVFLFTFRKHSRITGPILNNTGGSYNILYCGRKMEIWFGALTLKSRKF